MIPDETITQYGNPITAISQISFDCQRCGVCCRKRTGAPIILTGYDVYQIGRALGVQSTMDLLSMGIIGVVSNQYDLPTCILAINDTGACCLLDGDCCMVHDAKPVVCALYPLGRAYDATENQYIYIQPHGNKCNGTGAGEKVLVSQWLEQTGISNTEQYYAAYEQAYAEAVMASLGAKSPKYQKKIYLRTVWALIGGYNPQKPYLQQLAENMECLRPLLQRATRKQ